LSPIRTTDEVLARFVPESVNAMAYPTVATGGTRPVIVGPAPEPELDEAVPPTVFDEVAAAVEPDETVAEPEVDDAAAVLDEAVVVPELDEEVAAPELDEVAPDPELDDALLFAIEGPALDASVVVVRPPVEPVVAIVPELADVDEALLVEETETPPVELPDGFEELLLEECVLAALGGRKQPTPATTAQIRMARRRKESRIEVLRLGSCRWIA
jgi:hypothetical protein